MNALRLPNTLLDFTSKLGSSQEMAPPSDTAAPTRDPPGTWGPSLSLHLHILFQKRRNSQRARPVHTLCVCIKSNSQSCRWISANSLPPALPILQGTSALLASSNSPQPWCNCERCIRQTQLAGHSTQYLTETLQTCQNFTRDATRDHQTRGVRET